jgi:hypothetical protein
MEEASFSTKREVTIMETGAIIKCTVSEYFTIQTLPSLTRANGKMTNFMEKE